MSLALELIELAPASTPEPLGLCLHNPGRRTSGRPLIWIYSHPGSTILITLAYDFSELDTSPNRFNLSARSYPFHPSLVIVIIRLFLRHYRYIHSLDDL